MKKQELIKTLRSPLFAKRDNLDDAFNYLYSLIENLPNGQGAAIITGVAVVLNTLADELENVTP